MAPVSPATKGKRGLQLELSTKLLQSKLVPGQLGSVLVLKDSQVQQHPSKAASEYYLLKGQPCALHQLQNVSAINRVNFTSLIMFVDSTQRKKSTGLNKKFQTVVSLLGEIKTRHKLQGEIVYLKQGEQPLSDIHLGTNVSYWGEELGDIFLISRFCNHADTQPTKQNKTPLIG